MALEVCVLGSGSRGNCTFVRSPEASVLVDAGLSARETASRLAEADAELAHVQGVLLSHEHSDHTAGLKILHEKHGIPVYANGGTVDALVRKPAFENIHWQVFSTGSVFRIGDILVEPFSVPHDAYEPVGFILSSGPARLGIVTDMGVSTALIRERLKRCHAVVIESNHDVQMVQDAPRPWSLKQRILGRQGHLSNDGAADVLAEIAGPHLQQVFLAHISDECNRYDLALDTAVRTLKDSGHHHVKVCATFPNKISDCWVFESL